MTMANPRVFVDFNNADEQNRVYLTVTSRTVEGTCIDTVQDLTSAVHEAHLNQQSIQLVDGMILLLYQEDLIAEGKVEYNDEQGVWVAVVDWDHMRLVHHAA
jgi:hypothetical protein